MPFASPTPHAVGASDLPIGIAFSKSGTAKVLWGPFSDASRRVGGPQWEILPATCMPDRCTCAFLTPTQRGCEVRGGVAQRICATLFLRMGLGGGDSLREGATNG